MNRPMNGTNTMNHRFAPTATAPSAGETLDTVGGVVSTAALRSNTTSTQ